MSFPITGSGTGPHSFKMPGWISCSPFEDLLNISIVEVSGGQAELTMPFLLQYAQAAGLMHGGALVSLADTAVGLAIRSVLAPGTYYATIALEANYLLPVKQGIVTAKAKMTRREGRIIKGEATLYDEEERPVLEFRSTFKMAKDAAVKNVTYEK